MSPGQTPAPCPGTSERRALTPCQRAPECLLAVSDPSSPFSPWSYVLSPLWSVSVWSTSVCVTPQRHLEMEGGEPGPCGVLFLVAPSPLTLDR